MAAPAFATAIVGALLNVAGTLAGRVLVGLGVSVVTYTGMSTTLDFLKNQAVSSLSGLSADLVGLIAYLGTGQAISIVFSAFAVRMVLQGITSGTFKRWVLK